MSLNIVSPEFSFLEFNPDVDHQVCGTDLNDSLPAFNDLSIRAQVRVVGALPRPTTDKLYIGICDTKPADDCNCSADDIAINGNFDTDLSGWTADDFIWKDGRAAYQWTSGCHSGSVNQLTSFKTGYFRLYFSYVALSDFDIILRAYDGATILEEWNIPAVPDGLLHTEEIFYSVTTPTAANIKFGFACRSMSRVSGAPGVDSCGYTNDAETGIEFDYIKIYRTDSCKKLYDTGIELKPICSSYKFVQDPAPVDGGFDFCTINSPSENVVTNGDFETDLTDWDTDHAAWYAGKLQNTGIPCLPDVYIYDFSAVHTGIPLNAGKTYRCQFTYTWLLMTFPNGVHVRFQDGASTDLWTISLTPTDVDKVITKYFTVPADAVDYKLLFEGLASGASCGDPSPYGDIPAGALTFDNVEIREIDILNITATNSDAGYIPVPLGQYTKEEFFAILSQLLGITITGCNFYSCCKIPNVEFTHTSLADESEYDISLKSYWDLALIDFPQIPMDETFYRYKFTKVSGPWDICDFDSVNLAQLVFEGDATNYGGVYTEEDFWTFVSSKIGRTISSCADFMSSDLVKTFMLEVNDPDNGNSIYTFDRSQQDGIVLPNQCFKYCILDENHNVIACSNKFRRIDEECYTTVVEYWNNENGYGFKYPGQLASNLIRLPFYFAAPGYPKQEKIYKESGGYDRRLSTVIEKEYQAVSDYLPEWLHDKVIIALNHDHVLVTADRVQLFKEEISQQGAYAPDWKNQIDFRAQAAFKARKKFNGMNSNCSSCAQCCSDDILIDGDPAVSASADANGFITIASEKLYGSARYFIIFRDKEDVGYTPVILFSNTINFTIPPTGLQLCREYAVSIYAYNDCTRKVIYEADYQYATPTGKVSNLTVEYDGIVDGGAQFTLSFDKCPPDVFMQYKVIFPSGGTLLDIVGAYPDSFPVNISHSSGTYQFQVRNALPPSPYTFSDWSNIASITI